MSINVTISAGHIGYQYGVTGQWSGPVWLNSIKCTGNEKQLFNCSLVPTTYVYCDHNHDVGVRCAGKKYFC